MLDVLKFIVSIYIKKTPCVFTPTQSVTLRVRDYPAPQGAGENVLRFLSSPLLEGWRAATGVRIASLRGQ